MTKSAAKPLRHLIVLSSLPISAAILRSLFPEAKPHRASGELELRLLVGYLKVVTLGNDSPEESEEREKNFWAYERLDEYCREDPEATWGVIEAILQRDSSDVILSNLGAGPLEDLLVAHGARFIDRMEQRAAKDERFRKLLGVVWRHEIPEDVWQRIKAVAAPSW